MPIPQPQPTGALAAASWQEWVNSVYPPDHFMLNWQLYGVTIAVSGATGSSGGGVTTTGNISIQVPSFCYAFRSIGFVTSNGSTTLSGIYRIGIALASANDWTNTQWASQCVTGNGVATNDMTFPWMREIPASTQLTVTVVNPLNTAGLTVDASIAVIEPRRRNEPIRRSFSVASR